MGYYASSLSAHNRRVARVMALIHAWEVGSSTEERLSFTEEVAGSNPVHSPKGLYYVIPHSSIGRAFGC